MHTHTHPCTCTHTHSFTYTHAHTHSPMHMHTHTHSLIHIHTCTHSLTHAHAHTHTHSLTHIHTLTHTHAHTHTYSPHSCSNQLSLWPTRSLVCLVQGHVSEILCTPALCIVSSRCMCMYYNHSLPNSCVLTIYSLDVTLIGYSESLLPVWITVTGKATRAVSASQENQCWSVSELDG